MVSTYTTNNGIEKPGNGDQTNTWDVTANENYDWIDTSLDGQVTVTLPATGSSGSPNTLAITDGAASNGRNRYVKFSDGGDLGGTAYVQLTPNDAEKVMFVTNSLSGSRSILLFQGTYSASNDYELVAGETSIVRFDGTGSGAVVTRVVSDLGAPSAVAITGGTIASVTMTSVDINSGAIDGTTIGATSAAAISGTTIAASGAITGASVAATAAVTGATVTVTGLATAGDLTLSATDPEILGGDTDGILYIGPSTTKDLGGNWLLYGDTHATKANDAEFRATTGVELHYDDSGSLWDFQANALTTTGSVTIGTNLIHAGDTNNLIGFTTDTQTFQTGGSTRMDITDSGVQLGGSGARVTTVLDEDTMGSDSATALATQQSIKAYVDTSIAAVSTGLSLISSNAIVAGSATIDVTGLSGQRLVVAQLTGRASNAADLLIKARVSAGTWRTIATFSSLTGTTNDGVYGYVWIENFNNDDSTGRRHIKSSAGTSFAFTFSAAENDTSASVRIGMSARAEVWDEVRFELSTGQFAANISEVKAWGV